MIKKHLQFFDNYCIRCFRLAIKIMLFVLV